MHSEITTNYFVDNTYVQAFCSLVLATTFFDFNASTVCEGWHWSSVVQDPRLVKTGIDVAEGVLQILMIPIMIIDSFLLSRANWWEEAVPCQTPNEGTALGRRLGTRWRLRLHLNGLLVCIVHCVLFPIVRSTAGLYMVTSMIRPWHPTSLNLTVWYTPSRPSQCSSLRPASKVSDFSNTF